jgi:hypothetical protein
MPEAPGEDRHLNMEDGRMQALRFAGTPMILRQPLLIGIGIAFLLALLATHYEPDAAPTGGYGWLVGAGLMIGCLALAAWFLCAWEEVRADSALARPGQSLSIPHHPLELPTDLAHDPLALEAMALELSRLGPWPARRSGYVLVPGVEDSQTDGAPSRSRATRPFHGESVIEGAQETRDATRTAAGQPPG